MNLPNDIEFELLLSYVAESASPEEKLLVESAMAISQETCLTIDWIQDRLLDLAIYHAKTPRESSKTTILQTIGKWNEKGTLWDKWCLN
ncbi:MAG: hypothetical protein AAF985_15175 [Bacteroidota bacterium]